MEQWGCSDLLTPVKTSFQRGNFLNSLLISGGHPVYLSFASFPTPLFLRDHEQKELRAGRLLLAAQAVFFPAVAE